MYVFWMLKKLRLDGHYGHGELYVPKYIAEILFTFYIR